MTSSVTVLQERQPHRAPCSLPAGIKPQKVGRFRSKTAAVSSFLPLFFLQVHHFCSVMAISDRSFRFFRRTAHWVESEKHRSSTLVGGLRRGYMSDLAFHVKRFTRIHLALAQQVGKEEAMGARARCENSNSSSIHRARSQQNRCLTDVPTPQRAHFPS